MDPVNSINLIDADMNISCIYPFTGMINRSNYEKILNVLCTCFDGKYENKIKFIKRNMVNENFASIMNKETHDLYVDTSKRMCYKKIFGGEILKEIEKLIMPSIINQTKKLLIKPVEIILEQSHGDILYYDNGGFIDNHRDIESNFKQGNSEWKMHTIIVGLDSDIVARRKKIIKTYATICKGNYNRNEGATKVYLPHRSCLLQKKIYQVKLIEHIYEQSCIPAHFVVFPATALHSSIPITNGYKLALKLDVWMKIPNITNKINELSMHAYTKECVCVLCKNDYTYILKNKVSNDILTLINEYVADGCNIRNECICNNRTIYYCQCGCYNCFNNKRCSHALLRGENYFDDDNDRWCNDDYY
jgi:hypothetical protein